MIGVVATLHVKEGAGEGLEALFREIAAQVRANEPDNLVYELFRVKDDANTYKVIELYRDQAALEAHRQNAGVKALAGGLAELKAGPTVAEYYDGV